MPDLLAYTLSYGPGSGPHPLGRHVQLDPRSLAFAGPVLPRSVIQSVTWTRRCPVLDQGQLGSCTGDAAAGWVGTDNAARPGQPGIDQTTAEDLYHLATTLDEFPGVWRPDDSGSSGLGAVKALKAAGYIGAYTHAFSLAALATALQSGPALIGVPWYNSSFDPAGDGRIPVDTSTGLAGGHELCVDAYERRNGVDDRYWVTNSWGESWGVAGRAYFTALDLALLLTDDGDVTVPTPAAAPTPPLPPLDADAVFAGQLRAGGWLTNRHTGENAAVARAAKTWLTDRGL